MGGNIIKTAKVITKTAEKITLTATNGDITFNAAKSVKYSAKKDIIFDSYVASETQQTEELLVTKVICDVKELTIDIPYTFKAVQFSRKPKKEKDELKNVKWAYKIDDENIQDFPTGSTKHSYNEAIKKVTFDESFRDSKKITVYAYINTPSEKVSIEIPLVIPKVVITNKITGYTIQELKGLGTSKFAIYTPAVVVPTYKANVVLDKGSEEDEFQFFI
mgnify:CR=1 FL=1